MGSFEDTVFLSIATKPISFLEILDSLETQTALTFLSRLPNIVMAPRKRVAMRSRATRAAHDPRGNYGPPTDASDHNPTTITTTSALKPSTTAKPSSSFSAFDEDEAFKLNKKDRRTIKHNALLAKVHQGGIHKRPLKRRRPAKKLSVNLGGLGDALPDIGSNQSAGEDDDDWSGISDDEAMQGVGTRKRGAAKQPRMEMKSLKHRPGAMKRRHKLEQAERMRFGLNLAQMAGVEKGREVGGGGTGGNEGQVSAATDGTGLEQKERWAALRSFIGSTMEKNRAFAGA